MPEKELNIDIKNEQKQQKRNCKVPYHHVYGLQILSEYNGTRFMHNVSVTENNLEKFLHWLHMVHTN